jgi:indole-3-acetate monooxygenase
MRQVSLDRIGSEMTSTNETRILDGTAILANARAAVSALREEAAENERRRRLTERSVETLRSTGVFRMAMPRSWGGPELDPFTQLQIIETLSVADGSAGWCAMVGSDGGFYSANLDDDVGRALYGDLDTVTAGFVMPGGGRLRRVDGGYYLSGRWPFGSGSTHADVIVAGAHVYDGGEPVADGEGTPQWRVAMLPADGYEILDTWDVTGLAGSGSHDYTTTDTFVPAGQTFRFGEPRRGGALYAWPGLFIIKLLGVPLGIARAALDTAEAILQDKILMPEMRPARGDPRVRAAVARAEAMVGSARSYAFDVVGALWTPLQAGVEPSRRTRAAVGGSIPHVARTCREAVRLVADTVGSASIHRSSPLERQLRDLTTLCQHRLTQPSLLEVVGGLWFDHTDTNHPHLDHRLF